MINYIIYSTNSYLLKNIIKMHKIKTLTRCAMHVSSTVKSRAFPSTSKLTLPFSFLFFLEKGGIKVFLHQYTILKHKYRICIFFII